MNSSGGCINFWWLTAIKPAWTQACRSRKCQKRIIFSLDRKRAKKKLSQPMSSFMETKHTPAHPPTRSALYFSSCLTSFWSMSRYHSHGADLWGSLGLEGEPGSRTADFREWSQNWSGLRLFVCGTMACDSNYRHTGSRGTRADIKEEAVREGLREER